jgi:glutathione S-transferase
MLLYHTPTSPFVRKVMIAAHETGLISRIETTFLRPTPLATDAGLSKCNPLSRIPTLVLDDGTTLYDSPVILEYLDSLHTGEKLIPPSGPERFAVLKVQALCDGMLDSGVLCFYTSVSRRGRRWWQRCRSDSISAISQVDQGWSRCYNRF